MTAVDEPNDLLWESLKRICRAPAEAEFVRSEVGDDLFVANERLDQERRSLQAILNDLELPGASTIPDALRTAGAPLHQARQLAMRDRMQQLLFAADTGSVSFTSARERMVAEYIANGRQRPASGSARPASRGSRASSTGGSSRQSSRSTPRPYAVASDDVAVTTTLAAVAAAGKIQHTRIHEARDELRELLREEEASLLDEIEWLRMAIDDAIRWSAFAEPSPHEVGILQQKSTALEAADEHAASIDLLPSQDRSARLRPLVPTPPRHERRPL